MSNKDWKNKIDGLFDDFPANDILDAEELVNIDIDEITEESNKDALELIGNIEKYYYDEDFMKNNPKLKKRIDSELESLRILLKMRKSDEVTHDVLIKAISKNSSNASLYRSLTEIQKTIISITTKISEIITDLNNLLKNYQLEINFKDEDNENDIDPHKAIHNASRGTKDFILSLKEKGVNN